MATFTFGRHLDKIIQHVLKINASTEAWTVRPKDPCSVCVKLQWGPNAHLTRLLSKLRSMPFSVLLQDHTKLFPPAY